MNTSNKIPSNTYSQYFIDLLAAVAGLLHGPFEYFSDIRLLAPGFSDRVLFAGKDEAIKYLTGFIFDNKQIELIEKNTLLQHLQVDALKLRQLAGERPFYIFDFATEGYPLEPGTPFFKLSGNSFCTSVVAHFLSLICNFQTTHATKDHNENQWINTLTEGRASNVKTGFSRSPNPTIASFLARANHLAGGTRWINRRLNQPENLSDAENPDDNWRVSWESIKRRYDRKEVIKASKVYSNEEAEILFNSGFSGFYTHEFVANDLSGYAMDGVSKLPRYYISSKNYYYPQDILNRKITPENDVLLVDTYFYEIVTPGSLANGFPLYGSGLPSARSEDGRGIAEYLEKHHITGKTRAKYWEIPVLSVNDKKELMTIIEKTRAIVPDNSLLFRGQTNHYTVKRSPLVKQFLYGETNVDELSLTTTAARADFDFERFLWHFQLELQGLLYSDIPKEFFSAYTVDDMGTICFRHPEIVKRYEAWKTAGMNWETFVMGLAQHYGIPTYGLDITEDIEVALWMALNNAAPHSNTAGDQYFWNQPVNRDRDNPVVYFISCINSDTNLDLFEFPFIQSVRQRNQKAHLHFGGWGPHSNLCAEEVILAVRIGPGITSDLTPEYVYPQEAQDPLYKWLLDLKKKHVELSKFEGYEKIVEWKPKSFS